MVGDAEGWTVTPLTHDEAWQEVHVMATTLLAATLEMSEAAGVLNVSPELLAVREALESLNHAALRSVGEVH